MHLALLILAATSLLPIIISAAPSNNILTGIKCCMAGCNTCNSWHCKNCHASPYSTCCPTILAKKRDSGGSEIWYNEQGERITMVDMPEPPEIEAREAEALKADKGVLWAKKDADAEALKADKGVLWAKGAEAEASKGNNPVLWAKNAEAESLKTDKSVLWAKDAEPEALMADKAVLWAKDSEAEASKADKAVLWA
ncbi:hypothetical protein GLAREA_06191 [Glarea lozoyensis ATCC 20868]|uniref:Uncharacterized protein n=1 Tax=Glarea lozoyensis (strain ATCC 20868 / MF5171) TaxID=1116229 RepID=S3D7T1_GLAL2|nr:uncharacterized protein GLAREA_06191 [Glarea lozoyensis ATCC 20868]EPE33179.1 hypothetical protein GLAREA_06191 [Glarea lozoyensis ATCC 20868]